jgi:hypothetical protein
MEDLIELVAASLARHGIECPPSASVRVGTAALGCPAERNSAGNASADAVRLAELSLATALPDHNYRKSMQGDPAP